MDTLNDSPDRFSGISELLKKANRKNICVQTSNGYFLPVQRKWLKALAAGIRKNNQYFCGDILGATEHNIKITIS